MIIDFYTIRVIHRVFNRLDLIFRVNFYMRLVKDHINDIDRLVNEFEFSMIYN